MSGRFRIGVVLSTRSWPSDLHAFVSDHIPDTDLVVLRDERAALASQVHVLLVDETTPWLSAAFVGAAQDRGTRVVGVYDRVDDERGRQVLAELGIAHLVEAAMPPDDMVFLINRL